MDQADTVQRMAEAAGNFLASLDAAGRQKAVIDFADSTERENWHYVPRARAGLPLKEMDARQRELAHALGSNRSQRVGVRKSLDDHFAGADTRRARRSGAALPARSRVVSRKHFRRAGWRRTLGLAL